MSWSKRQTENGEMVALDALEQMNAELFELIGADTFEHRRAGRVEIGVEKVVRQASHGQACGIDRLQAAPPRRAPRRPRNGAGGCCRTGPQAARAPRRRSRGLSNRRAPSASVWSAPTTSRPGLSRAIAFAFSRASRRAASAGPSGPAAASTARSSRSGRLISTGRPAAFEHRPARCAARGEHQWLRGAPQRHGHSAGTRRRSASSDMIAAAVSSIERRVTSISGHSCLPHSRRENAISSATAWRSMYWSSSRWALRPSSRFWRICTMRSALANSPTTSGRRTVFERGRRRHARHQRNVGGLDAAVGEIDRGRRLRGPRHPDQDDIGILEIVGELAVVVHHGVVERVDPLEVFGIEDVLRADLMGRFGAEIGLEQPQHRPEDRQTGQAELAALVLQPVDQGLRRAACRG